MFNTPLDPHFLRILQNMISQVNPFAGIYCSVRDRVRLPLTDNSDDFRIILRMERATGDNRQYMLPSASEVAVLLPDQGDQASAGRDIVVEGRNGRLHRIDELHWAYDPLHYVLLFPRGEKGWSPNVIQLRHNTSNASDQSDSGNGSVNDSSPDDLAVRRSRRNPFVSTRQFYAHRLQVRSPNGSISFLHYFGRLFHQYIVDMY